MYPSSQSNYRFVEMSIQFDVTIRDPFHAEGTYFLNLEHLSKIQTWQNQFAIDEPQINHWCFPIINLYS